MRYRLRVSYEQFEAIFISIYSINEVLLRFEGNVVFFDAPQSMSHIFRTFLVQIIVLGLLHVFS